jgi:hypothetical protein
MQLTRAPRAHESGARRNCLIRVPRQVSLPGQLLEDEMTDKRTFENKPVEVIRNARIGDVGYAGGSKVPQSLVKFADGSERAVPTAELKNPGDPMAGRGQAT